MTPVKQTSLLHPYNWIMLYNKGYNYTTKATIINCHFTVDST